MRKLTILFIASIVTFLMLFTSACKDPELTISWNILEGSGYYNSQDDTSSITLSGFVELNIPRVATEDISANIQLWQFVIWEGDQSVLILNSSNYNTVLGDLTFNQSNEEYDNLWIYIETTTPKSGDIFNGANPDRMHLDLMIYDSNGQVYETRSEAPFEFIRN